jgi:hypothetical protein
MAFKSGDLNRHGIGVEKMRISLELFVINWVKTVKENTSLSLVVLFFY